MAEERREGEIKGGEPRDETGGSIEGGEMAV